MTLKEAMDKAELCHSETTKKLTQTIREVEDLYFWMNTLQYAKPGEDLDRDWALKRNLVLEILERFSWLGFGSLNEPEAPPFPQGPYWGPKKQTTRGITAEYFKDGKWRDLWEGG